jgi:hypothetical protein
MKEMNLAGASGGPTRQALIPGLSLMARSSTSGPYSVVCAEQGNGYHLCSVLHLPDLRTLFSSRMSGEHTTHLAVGILVYLLGNVFGGALKLCPDNPFVTVE